MFKFWIPIGSKEFFENINKSFGKDLFGFIFCHIQRIDTKWIVLIGWIKNNDVLSTMVWYMSHCFFNQISVRVNNCESSPLGEVIDNTADKKF